MNFSEQKSRGRKTRCLPASADTAWNLDQPLLEANTRRVIFLSTTRHAHAAGHVHHHSHHHVVRLSKLHNTTRLLSLKITVSCGNERSITQFSALVNPRIHKSSRPLYKVIYFLYLQLRTNIYRYIYIYLYYKS